MSFQPPPPSFLYGAGIGTIIYCLSRFLSHAIIQICPSSFQQKLANLNFAQLHHYHSLLPSTVHAIIQIVGTYNVVFHGDKDVLTFDDRLFVPYGITTLGPCFYMGFFVGYLLTDTALSPSLKVLGLPYAVHHISASMCWTFCASNRIMQNLASFLQFNELSTVMMNVRQVLLTAGYKSSDGIVVVVSLAFIALFSAVRVFPLPFLVHKWITYQFVSIRNEVGLGGASLLSLFLAVNVMLQGSWFAIMVRKLIELFTKSKKQSKGKEK
mmetsp:Transcript_5347/g.8210  ORF Transcript_5347/g.8210 Transcript_5347/m.8210 type:complete len:268 (-) Transcript_5347:97-900(-)